jgi:hypothetical protein
MFIFKKNKGCETVSQGLISLISTFSSSGAKEHIVFTNSTNSLDKNRKYFWCNTRDA